MMRLYIAALLLVVVGETHGADTPSQWRTERRGNEQRFERCLMESTKMTDHENRLTATNRQLVADLNATRAFLRRLLHPEDMGHAVSDEVRREAAALLAPRTGD